MVDRQHRETVIEDRVDLAARLPGPPVVDEPLAPPLRAAAEISPDDLDAGGAEFRQMRLTLWEVSMMAMRPASSLAAAPKGTSNIAIISRVIP